MTERRAPHGSDSSVQREAQLMMLEQLGDELDCTLAIDDRIGAMEIDGVSQSPPILVETWAHQGPPRGGQYHKVMNDAFKLIYARSIFKGAEQPKLRLMLAFADARAAAPFCGKSWRAQALDAAGIEVRVVDLPEVVRVGLRHTQEAQKQAMAHSVSEADGGTPR